MKQSVKTIVESIEKEIDYIMERQDTYRNQTEEDFKYGKIEFEIKISEKDSYGGEWDEVLSDTYIAITPISVTVTNENNKTLTNLSNEVFNQLELTYTNY